MRTITTGTITAYQRYISPYKGFRCAHKALHGGWSCSEFARRAALKHGPLLMLRLLPRRFSRCRIAYETLSSESESPEKRFEDEYSDCPWSKGIGWHLTGEAGCCALTGLISWF